MVRASAYLAVSCSPETLLSRQFIPTTDWTDQDNAAFLIIATATNRRRSKRRRLLKVFLCNDSRRAVVFIGVGKVFIIPFVGYGEGGVVVVGARILLSLNTSLID